MYFSIIKGIILQDIFRFILLTEPKKQKGHAESLTAGVHLYYLKVYQKKSVITIDPQGYDDTRGTVYVEMINETFRFVFSSVIDHINIAFFIVKRDTNRLELLTKYIFSIDTGYFLNIRKFYNYCYFCELIIKVPDFVESI